MPKLKAEAWPPFLFRQIGDAAGKISLASSGVRSVEPSSNHEDFEIGGRKILFEHACYRLLDELLVVVRVDQYADKRS